MQSGSHKLKIFTSHEKSEKQIRVGCQNTGKACMYNIKNQREGSKSKQKKKLDTKYKWIRIENKGKIINASFPKGNKKGLKKKAYTLLKKENNLMQN